MAINLVKFFYKEGKMKKIILNLTVVTSSLFAGDLVTFTSGTPAKASEVNANFNELVSRINNISNSEQIFSNGHFVKTKLKYDIISSGEGTGNIAI